MKNISSLFFSIAIIIFFLFGTAYTFWSTYRTTPTQQTLLSASLGKSIIATTPNLIATTLPPTPSQINLPLNTPTSPIITIPTPANPDIKPSVQNLPFNANSSAFVEKVPIIANQQAYITLPANIDSARPPALIIYNHGSSFTVSTNFTDLFMIKLQDYGKYFTEKGYVFAASNQHGDNWGNQAAIDDTNNLIIWLKSHYPLQNKVHLVGHSMGGTTALYYALRNPNQVRSISLLAPSINVVAWKATHFAILQNIPIAIWHGYQDNNVSWKVSQQFVDTRKLHGQQTLLTFISAADHWTIEEQVRKSVFEWLISI